MFNNENACPNRCRFVQSSDHNQLNTTFFRPHGRLGALTVLFVCRRPKMAHKHTPCTQIRTPPDKLVARLQPKYRYFYCLLLKCTKWWRSSTEFAQVQCQGLCSLSMLAWLHTDLCAKSLLVLCSMFMTLLFLFVVFFLFFSISFGTCASIDYTFEWNSRC